MMTSTFSKLIAVGFIAALAGCATATQDGPPTIVGYNHWDIQSRYNTRDLLFQNVSQEGLVQLLSGTTFVGYEETGGLGRGYGSITVLRYQANGDTYGCFVSYKTGKPGKGAYGGRPKQWKSNARRSAKFGFQYREIETVEFNGSSTYAQMLYNGQTGQIAHVAYDRGEHRDNRKGHLQKSIPAAAYKACPGWPSAESLGTVVNEKQTSFNYFKLLEQDKGDRVIRPDLVLANPTVYIDEPAQ